MKSNPVFLLELKIEERERRREIPPDKFLTADCMFAECIGACADSEAARLACFGAAEGARGFNITFANWEGINAASFGFGFGRS